MDPFLIQAEHWFRDQGDETLRLDYPLTSESIVFDLGGYHGDFAEAIYNKFGCKVYIFEPVEEFYKQCVARFEGNPKINCFNYGLSSKNEWLDIALAENASSFISQNIDGEMQRVELRSVTDCIEELSINNIDLMKINIEGGEFEVLPSLLESGDIKKINFIQIQFHNFVESAERKRNSIRNELRSTHKEMWNYEFVWECWEKDK
jgi:FkbM family methyltransferase